MATGTETLSSSELADGRKDKASKYDAFVSERISTVRSYVKLRDIAGGLFAWLAGLLAISIVAMVLDHWVFDLGIWGRLVAFAMLISWTVFTLMTRVLPAAMRRINPLYAAKVIEDSDRSLHDSLLNLILFRRRRSDLKEVVYKAVERDAVKRLAKVEVDAAVDQTSVIRVALVMALLMILFGAYAAFSPKSPFQTMARIAAPWMNFSRPARVRITEIKPGTTQVYFGRDLEVSAVVQRISEDEPIWLSYTSDNQQFVDRRIPMQPTDSAGTYAAKLPEDDDGIRYNLRYKIEAGDAIAGPYRVRVVPAPSIVVDRVQYEFPEYTGKPTEVAESVGDISAIEGTRVTIVASTNQPISSAYLEFDAERQRAANSALRDTIPMSQDFGSDPELAGRGKPNQVTQGTFTLLLNPERTEPMRQSYQVRFLNDRNESNDLPIQYDIDVIPDYAPEIEILEPEMRETRCPVNDARPIKIRAREPDFRLTSLKLHVVSAGKSIAVKELLDEPLEGQVQRRLTFNPRRLRLKPGDAAVIWATARDNRKHPITGDDDPNRVRTDRYKIHIDPPTDDPQQPQQRRQNQRQSEKDQNSGQGDSKGSDQNQSLKQMADDSQDDQDSDQNRAEEDSSSDSSDSDGSGSGAGEQGGSQEPSEGQSGGEDGQGSEGQGGSDGQGNQNGEGQGESNSGESGGADSSDSGSGNREGNDGESSSDSQGNSQNGGNQSRSGNESGGENSQGSRQNGSEGQGSRGNQRSGRDSSESNGSEGQSGQRQGGSQDNAGESPRGGDDSGSSSGSQDGGSQANREPVANDGSEDGDAFERIMNRMREQGRSLDEQDGQQDQEQQGGEDGQGERSENGQQADGNTDPQQSQGGERGDPSESTDGSGDQQQSGNQQPSGDSSSQQQSQRSGRATDESGQSSDSQSGEESSDQSNRDSQQESGPSPSARRDSPSQQQPSEQPSSNEQSSQGQSDSAPQEGSPSERQGERGDNESQNPDSANREPSQNQENGGGEPQQGQEQTGDQQQTGQREGQPQDGKRPDGTPYENSSDQQPGQPRPGENEAGEQVGQQQKPRPNQQADGEQGPTPNQGVPDQAKQSESQDGQQPGQTQAGEQTDGSSGDSSSPGEGEGGKQQPGGRKPGQTGSERSAQQAPDSSGRESGDSADGTTPGDSAGQQAGKQPGGEGEPQSPAGDQTGSTPSRDGSSQDPGSRSESDPPSGDQSEPTSGAGDTPMGGGRDRSTEAEPSADQAPEPGGDEANLEYARKATELVIDYLKDQQRKPDQKLLDELGWKPEELREFVERWQGMQNNSRAPGEDGQQAREELDDVLRGLGLQSDADRRRQAGTRTDQRGASDRGTRGRPPSEYLEGYKAYLKNRQRQNSGDLDRRSR